MKRRKGLLALKIILFMGKERPETVTAVAADASLPSSFTYQPKEKMGLRYGHHAVRRGLALLLHGRWVPSSDLSPKPQITEDMNTMGSELFFLFNGFSNKEEDTPGKKKRLTSRKALWKASDTYRSVRPSAMIPEIQNGES